MLNTRLTKFIQQALFHQIIIIIIKPNYAENMNQVSDDKYQQFQPVLPKKNKADRGP